MTNNHNNWLQEWQEQQKAKGEAAKKKLGAFCKWLETHYPDIHSIDAHYYGGGDSGCIEGVYCHDKDGKDIKKDFMTVFKEFDKAIEDNWQVDDIIMENLPFDWVNNYGGAGVATLYVAARELHYDHDQLVTVHHQVELEDEDQSPLQGQGEKDMTQVVEGR
jgi:hypothetical protein